MIIEINNAMSVCFKNRVIVYPIKVTGGWKIERQIEDRKPKTYDKIISEKEINEAVTKVYISIANKL